MAEYIKRDAFIAWLKRIPLKDLSDGRGLCRIIMEEDFKRAIRELPREVIADVAPVVHGRWVDNGIPGSMLSGCSVCGFTCGAYSFFYCPNCGARMDGEA